MTDNNPQKDNSKYNPTEFVRAVLCAMLISMLFSFVLACISGKHFPVSFAKVWASLDSSEALPVVFAGVWIVFYFGYMIDDFLQSELDREVSVGLLVAWFFFAAQVCSVGCLGLSTAFGCVGLCAVFVATKQGEAPKWRKRVWTAEDFGVAIIALLLCFWKNSLWCAILTGVFALEKMIVALVVKHLDKSKHKQE